MDRFEQRPRKTLTLAEIKRKLSRHAGALNKERVKLDKVIQDAETLRAANYQAYSHLKQAIEALGRTEA
jgi:hypothetical protein